MPTRLTKDELCWLQQTWIFSDPLKNHYFRGNCQVYISGEVCMWCDTGRGAVESPSPWFRPRSSWCAARFQERWGGAVGQSCMVPLLCPSCTLPAAALTPRALPRTFSAQSTVYIPPALPQPSKVVMAPETTKLPGPIANLLDPISPLCANEISILLFKPENRSSCK